METATAEDEITSTDFNLLDVMLDSHDASAEDEEKEREAERLKAKKKFYEAIHQSDPDIEATLREIQDDINGTHCVLPCLPSRKRNKKENDGEETESQNHIAG